MIENKGHPPRKDDSWLRKNASIITIAVGLTVHGVGFVRYATTLEKNQEAMMYRQDKMEASFNEWQKNRSLIPERVVRVETAVESLTNTVKELIMEMREDRRAERKQHRERQ